MSGARRVAPTTTRANEDRHEGRGRAYAFGWYCFLALIAVTPLIIGALPPQFGQIATFRGFDSVGLPKLVTILVFGGCRSQRCA